MMDIDTIIGVIAKNNAGEQTAIEGYFYLLTLIKENKLPLEFYQQVKEIISDELNHTIVLNNWIVKLSGIVPNKD